MSRAQRDAFDPRMPVATPCPKCGTVQASIVCSLCKTEKLPPKEIAAHYANRPINVPDDIQ